MFFFTLYYMYATFVQWWRLGALKNKVSGTLTNRNALLVCTGDTISDTKSKRCLENLLFHNGGRIGCTVVPKQTVNLNSWVSLPKDPKLFPIYLRNRNVCLEPPFVYLLVQAYLDCYRKHESEIVQIENFGDVIAWRASEHFEVVLKTDMEHLTKLVYIFSSNTIDINHELEVIRIETIDIEGNVSKLKYNKIYPIEQTIRYSHAPVHWKDFVREVRDLYQRVDNNPVIKVDGATSRCSEENKKVPVSEVRPMKKDDANATSKTPALEKPDCKENKCQLEVTAAKHTEINKGGTKKPKSTEPVTNKLKKSEPSHHKSKESTKKATDGNSAEKHKEDKRIVKDDPKVKREEFKTKGKHSKSEKATGKVDLNGTSTKIDKATKKDKETKAEVNAKEGGTKKEATTKEVPTTNGGVSQGTTQASPNKAKPPNVLVYADSLVAKENVKGVLNEILNREKYAVYDLPVNAVNGQLWNTSTVLVVVCGSVTPNLTHHLLQYLVNGGRLLCLCSDLLHSVLHTFTTAEVREHELVRFSYGEWKRVRMMHHIFCYQNSPAKKQFSKDSDQSNHSNGSSPVAPRTPTHAEIQHNGKNYSIQVQVLGAEETWQTPSLLLASVKNSSGKAIFSQVHLEVDPTQYQDDENKYAALKESNQARLEILKHILSTHLDIDCTLLNPITYSPAYFLGRHDLKLKLLSECEDIVDGKLELGDLTVVFCGKDAQAGLATDVRLPVLVHLCPSDFSTVQYFSSLKTDQVGRLVLYTDVLKSTQAILKKTLTHGVAVIARQQTQGVGRSNNLWISPPGSALFSLQLHIPMSSPLGKSLPLIQHLVMVAIVSSIKNKPGGYENLQIGIKWPNDLYANSTTKIGGLMVNSSIIGNSAIVNIGCGVNLDNVNPTTCINDLIKAYNHDSGAKLATIAYEEYFAGVFNEIESIYMTIQQNDDLDHLYDLYYKYWLHSGAEITVVNKEGSSKLVTIVGLDDFGYLRVRSLDGKLSSVQPDGNTFDMLKGLIGPKLL